MGVAIDDDAVALKQRDAFSAVAGSGRSALVMPFTSTPIIGVTGVIVTSVLMSRTPRQR
jgi:hypothetical protein